MGCTSSTSTAGVPPRSPSWHAGNNKFNSAQQGSSGGSKWGADHDAQLQLQPADCHVVVRPKPTPANRRSSFLEAHQLLQGGSISTSFGGSFDDSLFGSTARDGSVASVASTAAPHGSTIGYSSNATLPGCYAKENRSQDLDGRVGEAVTPSDVDAAASSHTLSAAHAALQQTIALSTGSPAVRSSSTSGPGSTSGTPHSVQSAGGAAALEVKSGVAAREHFRHRMRASRPGHHHAGGARSGDLAYTRRHSDVTSTSRRGQVGPVTGGSSRRSSNDATGSGANVARASRASDLAASTSLAQGRRHSDVTRYQGVNRRLLRQHLGNGDGGGGHVLVSNGSGAGKPAQRTATYGLPRTRAAMLADAGGLVGPRQNKSTTLRIMRARLGAPVRSAFRPFERAPVANLVAAR